MKRKYYRLDAEAALREKCLRMIIDMMRIMPCNQYRPLKDADNFYRFIIDYYRDNLGSLTLDPCEAMWQKYAPKQKEEENYDYLAL